MTKTKSSQKRIYLFAALLVAVALVAGIIPLTQTRASALERPGEFGSEINSIECTFGGEAATVRNYAAGYVVWKGTSNSGNENILKVVTMKKVEGTGGPSVDFDTLTVTNFTKAEVEAVAGSSLAYFRPNFDVGGWYGFGPAGRDAPGGYTSKFNNLVLTTQGSDENFRELTKKAYLYYYEHGLSDGKVYAEGDFNIGISIDDYKVWDGIGPAQRYWYGSVSNYNDGGQMNAVRMMYNPKLDGSRGTAEYSGIQDGFLVLHSEPLRIYLSSPSTLGIPYTNLELAAAIKSNLWGGSKVSLPADIEDTDLIQVFEKGIVTVSGGVGSITHVGVTTVNGTTVGLAGTDSAGLVFTEQMPDLTPAVWHDTERFTMGSAKAGEKVEIEAGNYIHGFYNYANGAAYAKFDKESPYARVALVQIGSAEFENVTSLDAAAINTKLSITLGNATLTRAQVKQLVKLAQTNKNAIGKQDDGSANQVNSLLSGTGHGLQAGTTNNLNAIVTTAYGAKFDALYAANKNPGIAQTAIKVWDGIIMMEMTLGDSTVSRNSRDGYSWLTYDATEQEVRYIRDEFLSYIAGNRERQEQSGYFLSDSHYVVNDNGTSRTVLLAVNGYYDLVGSTVAWHPGKIWVPADSGTPNVGAFVSTLTWRGDFGAKSGEPFDLDGYSYQNLTKGYLKYKVVGSEYVVTERANFNVSNNSGTLALTPLANDILWAGSEAFELATSGGDNVANTLPGLTEPQKATIIANFKQAVVDSVAAGWAPGFRISKVKNWDGFIVVEYKFGDGDMYHDGSPTSSRSKMTIFVMDTITFNVYMVGNYALLYGSSAKNSLGYAVSNYHSSITVKIGNENVALTNAQFFKQGYIHQVNGSARVVTGYNYTPAAGGESAKLDPAAAPKVPEGYGAETGRVNHGNNVYINYAKGTVKALVNKSGTGYMYTYYFGRTYTAGEGDAAPTLSKLPFDSIVALSDFKTSSEYGGLPEKYASDKNAFLKLFYDAYKYWYDNDIMLGKIDDGVKGWNGNNHILQFMFGDSSANPFGDSRTNIAALSYNHVADEIYLIVNGGMNAFSKDDVINMPKENPLFNEKLGVWTQRYSSGKYIVWLGSTGSVIDGEVLSYDDYIAGKTKITATHGKDSEKGYVETGEILLTELSLPEEVVNGVSEAVAEAAGAVTSSVSLVGAAFIGFNKKKSKSKLLGRLK